MLNKLNDILKTEHEKLLQEYDALKHPIYFIIAQPRGASTLFQQIMASNLDIGYISNLLAKFYKVPLFGMELEKDLTDLNFKSNFESKYGLSFGIHEPHEWGWFWKEMLKLDGDEHYSELENFEHVKKNLAAITTIKNRPIMIDNVFALSNLIKLKKSLGDNIRIINLTRDLFYVCNSIINARINKYNDINAFYGHPPKNIDKILKIRNPIEQVVVQVKSIQAELDEILSAFSDKHILNIDYEDIFNDSFGVVNQFYNFVRKDGFELVYKDKHLPILSYRNDPSLVNDNHKEELEYYYNLYIGKDR